MNRKNVLKFCAMLGYPDPHITGKGWASIPCPVAPWRAAHRHGEDEHPSLGVKVTDGISRVFCFTCKYSAELMQMVWFLERESKKDLTDLHRFIHTNETYSLEDLDARDEPDEPTKIVYTRKRLDKLSYQFSPIPISYKGKALEEEEERDLEEFMLDENLLKNFHQLSADALDYLTYRQVTQEEISRWELGWQPYARRITIPVRDPMGKLVGISGRSIHGEQPKYLHSTGFPRDYILYGEHLLGPGDTCYLTEGFFDVIRLHKYGYTTALSLQGTHVSAYQARRLVKRFKKVVLLLDGDPAGQEGIKKAYESLEGLVELQTITIPDDKDPGDLTEKEAHQLLG